MGHHCTCIEQRISRICSHCPILLHFLYFILHFYQADSHVRWLLDLIFKCPDAQPNALSRRSTNSTERGLEKCSITVAMTGVAGILLSVANGISAYSQYLVTTDQCAAAAVRLITWDVCPATVRGGQWGVRLLHRQVVAWGLGDRSSAEIWSRRSNWMVTF